MDDSLKDFINNILEGMDLGGGKGPAVKGSMEQKKFYDMAFKAGYQKGYEDAQNKAKEDLQRVLSKAKRIGVRR